MHSKLSLTFCRGEKSQLRCGCQQSEPFVIFFFGVSAASGPLQKSESFYLFKSHIQKLSRVIKNLTEDVDPY